MHVGVVTTSWPHEHDPVPGAFVLALTRALVARGHTATALFARHPSARARPCAIDRCETRSVRYAPAGRSLFYGEGAPTRLRASGAMPLAASFTAAMTLAASRSLARCDAIVSHFALPSALVSALPRGGRPHHAIVHGSDATLLARAPKALHRAIAASVTSLQFTHPRLREGLDPSLARHAAAFDEPMASDAPSAAARALREHTRATLGVGPHDTMVLTVARLAHIKGIDLLVDATRALPSSVKLVVAGDGPERAALERRADGRAVFLGAVDTDTRDRLLCAADVFALASREDSAPASVIEALRAGLPTVTTRVGGIAWLAQDGAWLVAPEDPRALADALNSLAESDALRSVLSQRALARSLSLPTWDALAARIERAILDARG
jgi:glycosyltransferase involved in cell wall biosynthesis